MANDAAKAADAVHAVSTAAGAAPAPADHKRFWQSNLREYGMLISLVAIMVLFQVLTDGSIDESPSFAPNGRMILYATEVRGRGVLSAVSSDGRVKQRLSENAADVREPAWGPLPK